MASLIVQKDVKIFHWKPAVAAGQWFLVNTIKIFLLLFVS